MDSRAFDIDDFFQASRSHCKEKIIKEVSANQTLTLGANKDKNYDPHERFVVIPGSIGKGAKLRLYDVNLHVQGPIADDVSIEFYSTYFSMHSKNVLVTGDIGDRVSIHDACQIAIKGQSGTNVKFSASNDIFLQNAADYLHLESMVGKIHCGYVGEHSEIIITEAGEGITCQGVGAYSRLRCNKDIHILECIGEHTFLRSYLGQVHYPEDTNHISVQLGPLAFSERLPSYISQPLLKTFSLFSYFHAKKTSPEEKVAVLPPTYPSKSHY